MTHKEVDIQDQQSRSVSIIKLIATRNTKKHKMPKRNRTRNELTDDLKDGDTQSSSDRDFRTTQGVRSQQIPPPERLRYPKILEKLLKIVKSAEEASKKEEVCGYTCPSRNQGVRIFWKIA